MTSFRNSWHVQDKPEHHYHDQEDQRNNDKEEDSFLHEEDHHDCQKDTHSNDSNRPTKEESNDKGGDTGDNDDDDTFSESGGVQHTDRSADSEDHLMHDSSHHDDDHGHNEDGDDIDSTNHSKMEEAEDPSFSGLPEDEDGDRSGKLVLGSISKDDASTMTPATYDESEMTPTSGMMGLDSPLQKPRHIEFKLHKYNGITEASKKQKRRPRTPTTSKPLKYRKRAKSTASGAPRMRCGMCEACLRPDCGICADCRKKKRFGGSGNAKQACVQRRCVNLQDRQMKRRGAGSSFAHRSMDGEYFVSHPTSMTSRYLPNICTLETPPMTKCAFAELLCQTKKQQRLNRKESKSGHIGETTPTFASSMYGIPVRNLNTKVVCHGCGDPHVIDDILLCDGPGCRNEFHLQCCRPPLMDIPEGLYYCVDCHPEGSTTALREYFQAHGETKANFSFQQQNPFRSFALHLLRKDVIAKQAQSHIHDHEHNDPESSNVPQAKKEDQRQFSKQKTEANSSTTVKVSTGVLIEEEEPGIDDESSKHDNQKAETTFESLRLPRTELPQGQPPEEMVGKPLRLYCANDNLYHNGRIVAFRKTAAFKKNHDEDEQDKVEYLVRFAAGRDYRKTSLTHWIVLEEHGVAVATELIWGAFPRKRQPKPGQIWNRTARELVPVCDDLHEDLGQIVYHDSPQLASGDVDGHLWVLAKPMIGETFRFMLSDDVVRAIVAPQDQAQPQLPLQPKDAAGVGQPRLDKETSLLYAMALAELAERERVRYWHRRLPLHNPAGPSALRSRDEFTLGPLLPWDHSGNGEKSNADVKDDGKGNDKDAEDLPSKTKKIYHADPSPLVQVGLDRAYIMNQLVGKTSPGTLSKEMMASLTCETVSSIPKALEAIHHHHRLQEEERLMSELRDSEDKTKMEGTNQDGQKGTG